MKRQNLFLLINLGIMLVIGLAYIIVNQSVVLHDDEDKLFGQKVDLINGQQLVEIPELSVSSRNIHIIDYKWTAVDKNEDVVGTVYHVIIKNDFPLAGTDLDYGVMEFLVGIDTYNEVFVQYIRIYQSSWAVVGIQKYIQDNYNGISYLSVNDVPSFDADIVSGATENPATVSTDSVKTMIQDVIVLHYNLAEEDPYVDIFGIMDYDLSVDATFIPTEHITTKLIVSDQTNELGYIYSITGRGEYQDGAYDTIVINIVFDMTGEIVGVLLPEETYNHSIGSYGNKNKTYVEEYVGLTLNDIQAKVDSNGSQDVTAGASNTRALIDALLEFFVSEVN
ncbi:hypothetical protein [Mariniplasma anaerobium]|uniref:FMN-binding protein n=1 Tax=Mariniplasma anaerobium TaxID=2735436 RepID=A0A7U9TKA3_9MOLU|nr:hypothetical protein [Mariniplasma anaerobium]BCR35301.1 hypothetical protein MPAN_001940 [Mariniplasma anaerobium]